MLPDVAPKPRNTKAVGRSDPVDRTDQMTPNQRSKSHDKVIDCLQASIFSTDLFDFISFVDLIWV